MRIQHVTSSWRCNHTDGLRRDRPSRSRRCAVRSDCEGWQRLNVDAVSAAGLAVGAARLIQDNGPGPIKAAVAIEEESRAGGWVAS